MRVVLSLFENAKGIFGIEDNKPDCIEKLKELTKDEPRMEVKVLQTKYPQGAERQLIYATTNRAITSSMLPADAGCIVDNVETLRFRRPLFPESHSMKELSLSAEMRSKNLAIFLLLAA